MQTLCIKSAEALVISSGIKSGKFSEILVLPKIIKHRSLRSLPVKLIKIGAKIVRNHRYATSQTAEVAIDKRLFTEILYQIERLRYCSF